VLRWKNPQERLRSASQFFSFLLSDVSFLFSSRNLARNQCVFVERVNRAQPMITIGDHDLAVLVVSDQKKRRERLSAFDSLAVFFYVIIAQAEKRQARRSENILRFELGQLRAPQLFDVRRSRPLVVQQS